MPKASSLLRLGALACGLALAGCAPTFGPNLQYGSSPGIRLGIRSASCAMTGTGIPEARFSSSLGFEVARQQMNAIQAYFSPLRNDPTVQMQTWKRLAAGGC